MDEIEALQEEREAMGLPRLDPVPSDAPRWSAAQLAAFFDSDGAEIPPPLPPSRHIPPPLPPFKRLSSAELSQRAGRAALGEWYQLEIPTRFDQLTAHWLTTAFQAAGTLPRENSVSRVVSCTELPVGGGFDCAGGAGRKAFITVEFAEPSDQLHRELFVKMPWEASNKYRQLISSAYGDGDALELSVYCYLESSLPVRIPKFYFGDISRETTDYVLVTERIMYGQGGILPACGKYQDYTLQQAHRYYYALFRALARIAGQDKLGRFKQFPCGPAPAALPAIPTDKLARRREAARSMVSRQLTVLEEFVLEIAPQVLYRYYI